MLYRFLLFVLLLFVTTFYIMMDGLTHPYTLRSGIESGNASAWTSAWSIDWEQCTDKGASHPTVEAYASASVTKYEVDNSMHSGSGSIETNDEYGFGHASVSAITYEYPNDDGEMEPYEPRGKVQHTAFVFINYSGGWLMGEKESVWIIGDNNINHRTKYDGAYSEDTTAYNRWGRMYENFHVSAEGACYISNYEDPEGSASAEAYAP